MFGSRVTCLLLNGVGRQVRMCKKPRRFVAQGLAPLCQFFHSGTPNYIFKSNFPDIVIPDTTITELIWRDFNKFGSKTALIDGNTGHSLTFDQVKDSIWKIASGMAKQGFKKDDVLMVISENSIDYILIFHAALSLGGVITTCNPHYLSADIVRQVEHSNTSYIFSSQMCASKTKDVLSKVNNVKKVFVSGHADGFMPVSQLLEDDGLDFPNKPLSDVNSMAILPYSSGTTGLPKGVMLSHRNMISNTLQIDVPKYMPDHCNDQLALLPFYHIFGIIVHCFCCLRTGLTAVVLPGFDPLLFLQSIQKYKVNMIHLVPPILTFMTKHPMVSKFDMSSLRRLVSGAAPMGVEVITQFNEKFPDCIVGQGYGLTETSPVISLNPEPTCRPKSSSSGCLVPNTEIKIIDGEKKEVPFGERGELCVRGPQVMVGYLNNPSATANTIDSDGWLHTGDVCNIDKDGFLYVVDRVKELIKFKGLQVPPAELEDLLCSHPCVADAAVIGIPDQEAGELPKAFVSLKPNAKISIEELDTYVAERVAPYKRLRGGISLIPQIPRSPAGKILRKDLKVSV